MADRQLYAQTVSRSMKVLITGALGFIGTHLAEAFLARGDDVIGIDDLSGNVIDEVDGMRLFPIDARYTNSINPTADLVVHARARSGRSRSWTGQSNRRRDRRDHPGRARLLRVDRARLVNISSSEVYGFSGVYRETDACMSRTPLAPDPVRRRQARRRTSRQHELVPSVTVRPFNVAGPRQSRAKGFVLPTFVEQALGGRALTVFGRHQERSFTAVWDVWTSSPAAGVRRVRCS